MRKKIILTVILCLLCFGITANAEWYDNEIAEIKNMGFISNELFDSPDKSITRQEICSVMASLYKYKNPNAEIEQKQNGFTDITNSTYKNDIETAYSLGIISGTEADKFSPDGLLTREQFVSLIYRMQGSPMAAVRDYYDIEEVSDYALPAIDYAITEGIVKGTSKGYFSPKNSITRAEALVIVKRLAQKVTETGAVIRKSAIETDDQIFFVARQSEIIANNFDILLSKGLPAPNRKKDIFVIIDKKTSQRKFVELDEIVSLGMFDLGDSVFVPCIKYSTLNRYADSTIENGYVINKATGECNEIKTAPMRDAIAYYKDCIYYTGVFITESGGLILCLSKYNLKTGEITSNKTVKNFEPYSYNVASTIWSHGNMLGINAGTKDGLNMYKINLDDLTYTVTERDNIASNSETYYARYTDKQNGILGIFEENTNKLLKSINIEDVCSLVSLSTDNKANISPYLSNCHYFEFKDDIYMYYSSMITAKCITDEDKFDIDIVNANLNNGEEDINPDRGSGRFSFGSSFSVHSRYAVYGSLYNRGIYGDFPLYNDLAKANRTILNFIRNYRNTYRNPYDLTAAVNRFLTYECNYDYDTFNEIKSGRKYNPYSYSGLIIEHSGVCEGYAHTMNLILTYAGVKNKFLITVAEGNHEYNMVQLDGKKYFFDCTWNSCVKDENRYTMMTREEMANIHTPGSNEDYYIY